MQDQIKQIQTKLGLVPDGVAGPMTWNTIAAKLGIAPIDTTLLSSATTISDAAYKLIIKYEVGGGEAYYNKCLKTPEYAGGQSGVTIGVGYDLGYTSAEQFKSDWSQFLTNNDYLLLASCIGAVGLTSKKLLPKVSGITIPWSAAESVFKKCDIPRYIEQTIAAFPTSDKLKPDAFGALVSLVFNRGGSMTGDSRLEMRNIRDAISGVIHVENVYQYIADQFLSMKRLWIGKGLDGLLARRGEEAALINDCQ